MTTERVDRTAGRTRRASAVVGVPALLALLLTACGGGSSPAIPPVQLSAFHGPGFSVGFPTKPRHLTLTVQDGPRTVKARLYYSKADSVAFEVAVLPPGVAPGSLTHGLISPASAEHESTTTYAGFPTTDVRVTNVGAQDGTLFLREVKARTRTLFLVYLVAHGEFATPPPGEVAFVSSLRIR